MRSDDASESGNPENPGIFDSLGSSKSFQRHSAEALELYFSMQRSVKHRIGGSIDLAVSEDREEIAVAIWARVAAGVAERHLAREGLAVVLTVGMPHERRGGPIEIGSRLGADTRHTIQDIGTAARGKKRLMFPYRQGSPACLEWRSISWKRGGRLSEHLKYVAGNMHVSKLTCHNN
jgi:hypothetical protein